MKEMRGMLAGCMSGNLSQLSDYNFLFYEDAHHYLVKVIPTNESIKDYITGFDLYMDKIDLSVSKLRITERGKNYTDYQFVHKKFNTLTDDEKFSVR